MPRTILHLDLDAFFCAVEETRDPSLRGKAFAVGGKPDERGVVASCSYAARMVGVRSAMPMARALRLCPQLIIVSSRHRVYGEVSKQVMARLNKLTPLVEQISIDEAFLDISDINESPERLARGLSSGHPRRTEFAVLDWNCNEQIGSKDRYRGRKERRQKWKPALCIDDCSRGRRSRIHGIPSSEMLWGVGPKTSARLNELGIHTIGDIAKWPESEMIRLFGENGRELSRHAKGIDDRPIMTERETKSISQEETFARDVRDDKSLEKKVREQRRGCVAIEKKQPGRDNHQTKNPLA